jgi:mono/diheme cytochrome c family protein
MSLTLLSAAARQPAQADNAHGTQAADAAFAAPDIKALVDRYCVTCHNDRLNTGGVSLQAIDFADPWADRSVLERAVRKVRVGAMPPQGAPRPDKAALARFAGTIEAIFDRDAQAHPDPGRAILRRLNRTEYANAVHDLLAVDVDVSTVLPADNSSFGFDNIGDVLAISPVLMERYLTAARTISSTAVGDAAEIGAVDDTYRTKPDLSQGDHIEGLPLGTRGGLVVTHSFPLDAEYRFTIHLRQTTLNNVVGLEYPHEVVLLIDGREMHRAAIGGLDDLTLSFRNSQAASEILDARLGARLRLPAGPHAVGATFVAKTSALRAGLLQPILRTTFDGQDYTGIPHIERLVITGPFDATGPGDTPSRRRIFICRPSSPRQGDEHACARRILGTLAARAYRRPLDDRDIGTLLRFYDEGRRGGSFDTGVELGLRRILASPDFVLRIERDPAGDAPGSVHAVSDVELASRLSFFLWGSLPDVELMQVAAAGQLRKPAVIEAQVRRMLADPRSASLVDNFAGQWLYLRNLAHAAPVPTEFPDFDDNLRTSMIREVKLFVDSIVRDDRSVLDLLTARDTYLNERLARHYGVPGIYGDQFRRLTLPQDERRGLLGKGAILVVTSLASRTSPVVRGKWILDNIVGTPPPPPPPNVPALDEQGVAAGKTLRARMEAHRGNAQCATCHRMMDPIGFALENYDAAGRWRTRDGAAQIDAAGTLMDGTAVDGPSSLREALTKTPDTFVRTMTEKLMTYALGRGLDASDMPAVRQVTRAMADANLRFSSMVLGIVRSVPFQMRRTRAAE